MDIKFQQIFNTPLEFALRIIFLLDKTNKKLDLQRIVYYNYLLVHSSDIEGGPKSIHPEMPNRSCEILVTRKLIKEGLKILLARELIEVIYSKNGICYKKNKNTSLIIEHFDTSYSKELNKVSQWVFDNFDGMSDSALNKFMSENLNKWGSEFTLSMPNE